MLVPVVFLDSDKVSDFAIMDAMSKNAKIAVRSQILKMLAQMHNNFSEEIELVPGVYELGGGNFNNYFNKDYIEAYPKVEGISCYGVCDSVENLLEHCSELINSDRKFAIGLWPHKKADQSSEGGWRWHKWGPYIGKQKPTTEYLYDEPEIDLIYTYEIIEFLSKEE